MKIGIDISQIIYGTGVSVYTKSLVISLLKIDKDNEYILFGGSFRRKGEIEGFIRSLKGNNFAGIVYPLPPSFLDFLWNRLHIANIEGIIGKIDVFHSSDWAQPPTSAYKITTIHDLIPDLYPQWSHSKIISVHDRKLHWVKKEVDKIIVPSETTKKDLIKLEFDEKRIVVIPEAPSEAFTKQDRKSVDKFKQKYGISEDYLLAIGVTPRKNIKRIVKAFTKLNIKGYELVVVGHAYDRKVCEKSVKYLGHLEDEEMPLVYSGADLFVYPSLYEGFGLPILESFACETPVITSNMGSMKEVAGDAAVLVNPESHKSIAEGINKGLKNKSVLVEKGNKRVKQFSWKDTAEKTLKLYMEGKH